MIINGKVLDMSRTHVMGILNVTPDSFSDGGSYCDLDSALAHAEKMVHDGAAVIDIGGESTRPGHQQISEAEEIERVCQVIEAIKKRIDIPISIDTYKAPVAKAALEAGADVVNDIWGLQYERYCVDETESSDETKSSDDTDLAVKSSDICAMAKVVKEFDVPIILMHNDCLGRSLEDRNKETVTRFIRANNQYSSIKLMRSVKESNIVERVVGGLAHSIEIAAKAGIDRDKLILDPGVGFAKTQNENLMVLNRLREIKKGLGLPMLLAASRKSVIGNVLDLAPEDREEGTLVTTILAAESGYSFVRVHDVEKSVRAIKMLEAIMQK